VTTVTIEGLSNDPHPILHGLRAEGPVSRVPALDAWLVTSHEHCTAFMLDAGTFTVQDPRFSTQQVIGPSMLSLDGAEHRRHRDPFAGPFRAKQIRRLEARARAETDRLVDQFARLGSGDLRSIIAGPLAVSLMTELLDLEGVEPRDVLTWYRDIVDAVHSVTAGEAVPESGLEAFAQLRDAVSRNGPHSRFLASVSEDGSLTSDEIASNIAVLLFGGIVTAESSTAIALRYLLADPALSELLRHDRSLVRPFVEETLRLEPSAAAVDRYATRQVEAGGVSIGSGDLVRISLSAANRDPRVFTDPDRLDLTRPNTAQHLTFARGPHSCLGVHLARLEIAVVINALFDDVAGVAGDGLDPVEGLVFRAPATVRARVS
jgi:cytochrome P450